MFFLNEESRLKIMYACVCVCIACICMCIYLWHKTRKQLVRGEKSFKGPGKTRQCVHENSKGWKGSQRGGGVRRMAGNKYNAIENAMETHHCVY